MRLCLAFIHIPFQGVAGGYMHKALGASSEYGAPIAWFRSGDDCGTFTPQRSSVVHAVNRWIFAMAAGVGSLYSTKNGGLAEADTTGRQLISQKTCKVKMDTNTKRAEHECIISTANL